MRAHKDTARAALAGHAARQRCSPAPSVGPIFQHTRLHPDWHLLTPFASSLSLLTAGGDWVALPNVQPEQIVSARALRRFFTGDLDAKVRIGCLLACLQERDGR